MKYIKPNDFEIENGFNHIHNKNSEKKTYLDKIINKPWGKEYLVFQNEKIGIWILHIEQDKETSLHCHFKKDSLMIVLDGSFKINLYDEKYEILNTLESLYIPKYVFHGIYGYGVNNILMEIEIYTDSINYSDKNDLLRIKDIHNRKDSSYENSINISQPECNENINFHCNNDFTFNNTKLKIYNIDNFNHNIVRNYNIDFALILEGNIYQNNILSPGSFFEFNNDNYSLLTNNVKILTFENMYFPLTNKIIYSQKHLQDMLNIKKFDNIGLTSGCFDIIHTGHFKTLKIAKQNCSHLFICLSSDEQIKYLKGDKRPINSINDRLHMLIHMDFIDYIILYNEVNDNNESVLDNIMNIIKPETWFKGTDYNKEDILQKHPSLKNIILIELEENKSTTNIIKKIIN